MKTKASSLKLGMVSGAVLTAIATAAFYALPNSPLLAPGLAFAFIATGGVHDGHFDGPLYWTIAICVNYVVYSFVAWICVAIFQRRGRNRQTPA
jgi:hypothetical protein